ncbi:hypothetical protein AB0K16_20605 [Nonomuraea jabiensis]|uniref:hypothetical protein n=1 Tax=Nonomuraea jabiensis TaxID=882448 RepID=UPI00342A3828
MSRRSGTTTAIAAAVADLTSTAPPTGADSSGMAGCPVPPLAALAIGAVVWERRVGAAGHRLPALLVELAYAGRVCRRNARAKSERAAWVARPWPCAAGRVACGDLGCDGVGIRRIEATS